MCRRAASSEGRIPCGPAIRFLLDGDRSDGSRALFEFDVPTGARLPAAHSYDGYDETIDGIRGTLTGTIQGRAIEVGPGEALHIRRGIVHRFDNHGTEDATPLAVVTPGILSPSDFRELAAAAEASAGGPPDLPEIHRIMRRHGLTPAD